MDADGSLCSLSDGCYEMMPMYAYNRSPVSARPLRDMA